MLRSYPSKRSVLLARAWKADCLAVTGRFSFSFLFSTCKTFCLLVEISRSAFSCVFSSFKFSIHTLTRAYLDFTISNLLEIYLKLRVFQGESSPMISLVIFQIFANSSLYSFAISLVCFNSSIVILWSLFMVVTSLVVDLRVCPISLFSLVKLQFSIVSNSFYRIRDDIWALLLSRVSASCVFSLSISSSLGSDVSITSERLSDVLPVGS